MRKLYALIKKESYQIVRDPSSILIAFVLPLILLFIFGYGVNLDNNQVNIAVVTEDDSPEADSLVAGFTNSRFFNVSVGRDRREFEEGLVSGEFRGLVIIPQDFTRHIRAGIDPAQLQVITDGTVPNIASFVQNYVRGVVQVWQEYRRGENGQSGGGQLIRTEPRFWYNQELQSRNFLIPGSIAIIMTLIGTLLSSLVIAREWERGTMEAIMTTPVTISEIILGKLIPYYILGMCSMVVCWSIAVLWYDVPFRGSFWVLLLVTSVFLVTALGQGLLISSASKDQFVASQIALLLAFLPAFMLSGFIFEISAMPVPVRGVTYVISARYLVTCLQTLFLTGTIWPLLIKSMISLALIACVFYIITSRKMVKRL